MSLVSNHLRGFSGYRSARSESVDGDVWLNANESARPNATDSGGLLRRYPQPQPQALRAALAMLYGCDEAQLLVGRGSDEAIDLLVRAFCTPGRDGVVVTPPVFGMYAVCARLQGAPLFEVPLCDGNEDFGLDLNEVGRVALARRAKLVFLCSPGNPAGGTLAAEAVVRLAQQLEGAALVVVDEAYIEFSDASSLVAQIRDQPNIAALRTLSKAHALAGARIGCLIANPEVIAALRHCQAPYPVPAPCAELALQALSADALEDTARGVARVRSERARLRTALQSTPGMRRVYPSQANFVLARFDDASAAFQHLLDAGIVVRDMRAMPQLDDALRITVGTEEENARVISTLNLQVAA
jgi:histidinol-phosphate aminotransferase